MKTEYNGNTFHFCGKDWKFKEVLASDLNKALIKVFDESKYLLEAPTDSINVTKAIDEVYGRYVDVCTLLLEGFTKEDMKNLSSRDQILLPHLPISLYYTSQTLNKKK